MADEQPILGGRRVDAGASAKKAVRETDEALRGMEARLVRIAAKSKEFADHVQRAGKHSAGGGLGDAGGLGPFSGAAGHAAPGLASRAGTNTMAWARAKAPGASNAAGSALGSFGGILAANALGNAKASFGAAMGSAEQQDLLMNRLALSTSTSEVGKYKKDYQANWAKVMAGSRSVEDGMSRAGNLMGVAGLNADQRQGSAWQKTNTMVGVAALMNPQMASADIASSFGGNVTNQKTVMAGRVTGIQTREKNAAGEWTSKNPAQIAKQVMAKAAKGKRMTMAQLRNELAPGGGLFLWLDYLGFDAGMKQMVSDEIMAMATDSPDKAGNYDSYSTGKSMEQKNKRTDVRTTSAQGRTDQDLQKEAQTTKATTAWAETMDDVAEKFQAAVGKLISWLTPMNRGGAESGDGPGANNFMTMPKMSGQHVHGPSCGHEQGGPTAGGGTSGYTYPILESLMAKEGLTGYRVTSRKRSGSGTSFHNRGQALDIAGPRPGDHSSMLKINRFWAKYGGGLEELIYSGKDGINLLDGRPHTYSSSTRADHYDHVHVAASLESLAKIGVKADGSGAVAGALPDGNAAGPSNARGAMRRIGSAASRFSIGMGLTGMMGNVYSIAGALGQGGGGGGAVSRGSARNVAGGDSGGDGKSQSPSGPLGYKDVYGFAKSAGFGDAQARVMTAIAMGESGLNARAHNPNASTGDNSYGLWQINMLGSMGPARRKAFGIQSNDELFDPRVNARAAKNIHGSQGYRAWSIYKSGSHQQYLDDVDAALRNGSAQPASGKKPEAATGMWDVKQDMDARIHSGEMVLPATTARAVRAGKGFGGGGGNTFHFRIYTSGSDSDAIRFAKKVKAVLDDESMISQLGSL